MYIMNVCICMYIMNVDMNVANKLHILPQLIHIGTKRPHTTSAHLRMAHASET